MFLMGDGRNVVDHECGDGRTKGKPRNPLGERILGLDLELESLNKCLFVLLDLIEIKRD